MMPALPGATWAILLIISPLTAAVVAFLAQRAAFAVACVNATVTTAAAVALLRVVDARPLAYHIGDWSAPLGIELFADSLSAVLCVTASVVVLAITLYAPAYLARSRTDVAFWPLVLFLHAALNGLFLSADVFNLYVVLELLSLSAVALVALGNSSAALAAALRYLLASLVASLAYLLGVALLYHAYGALDLGLLAGAVGAGPTPWAALGLMTAGLVLKGGLFPLHFWLPRAHSEAPGPVSALLSGLVVKAPFYVLLRLWFGPFEAATQAVAVLLGLLGTLAILWGSVQALRQSRLKLLVAYSTVAQVGYLFLYFPLADTPGTLDAITVLVPAHALAKAAMFLAAGNILLCTGHDRIGEFDRVAGRMPLAIAAFGIAGVCIMGLPPSGNFVAKWLLIGAAIERGAWGWAIVIVVGTLLAAAYVFRVVGHAFTPRHVAAPVERITTTMAWVPMLLALAALLLGLVAMPMLECAGAPELTAPAAAVRLP